MAVRVEGVQGRMGGMRVVIFGLTVSSSWGNGHATLWRGLLRAMAERGHTVTFFEKDVPYYRDARDLTELPGGGTLRLYDTLAAVRAQAERALGEADLAIVSSYCPEGAAVAAMLLASQARLKAFYDLDTPVTLDALDAGNWPDYLPPDGLGAFDIVLSYTGGRALEALERRLGARDPVPLYGWVDPASHYPVPAEAHYACDLSYLGTYAPDRQAALDTLFLEPARRRLQKRFLIGGAQYPESFPWTANLYFHRHVPPSAHPAFFSSSRFTLNITRRAMAAYGYCPSGRLFEAAACGTALISDTWEGLDAFFKTGEQIVIALCAQDTIDALGMSDAERLRMAAAAREHTLAHHTAAARVRTLESACEAALQRQRRVVLQETA